MAGATNYMANACLAAVFSSTSGHWLGLHTSDPTPTGNPATELVGASYIRQSMTWTTAANRTTSNSNTVTFQNLPAATIGYLCVWDAQTAGHAMFSISIPHIVVISGGSLIVPINDIAITFP